MRVRSTAAVGAVIAAVVALCFPGMATAAPSWLEVHEISPSGTPAEGRIAVGGTDGDTAVWQQKQGMEFFVAAATRPPGEGWTGAARLSAPGGAAGSPEVAMDAAGDAIAVWRRYDGSNFVVQAASQPAGGAWQPPASLSAAGQNAEAPEVAMDAAGDAIAVWRRYDGLHYRVQSAFRPTGGAWSPPQDISSPGENCDAPQVAISASGEAVAAWEQGEASGTAVAAATRSPSGGWSAPGEISAPGGEAREPQVALDAAGDAIAVWRRYDGSNFVVQAASQPAGGAWQPPASLSAPGRNAEAPEVAMDAAGDAIAVWRRYDGSNFVIQAASQPAGGAWQPAASLSAAGQNAEAPALAMNAGGKAIASWARFDGANYLAEAALGSSSGAWQPPTKLSSPGGQAQEPRSVIDPEGNAAVVWSLYTVGFGVLQTVGYDAAGPQLRALSIPTAATVDQPLEFSLSSFDAWSRLAPTAWSFGDGSTATGSSVAHAYAQPGTYALTVTTADVLSNQTGSGATVTIFPKPFAERIVWVVGGRALLRLHCPSTAGCAGDLTLVVGVPVTNHGKVRWERRPVGESHFQVPPASTTSVSVPLSAAGRMVLARTSKPHLKAQLTGPGVRHRAVVMVDARAYPPRRGAVGGGKVRLRLRCPGFGTCRGSLRLRTVPAAGPRAGRAVLIGSGRFTVAPSRSAVVDVPLNGAGTRLMRNARRLVVELSGAGLRPTRTLLLKG